MKNDAGLSSRHVRLLVARRKGSGVFFGRVGFQLANLQPKKTPDPVRARRRGVVLVAVLVALLVVMLISATIVRGLVVQHRLARTEQQRVQAFWFAESAVQRAQTQIKSNPEYVGETWRIELPPGGRVTGQAVIRIEPIQNEPDQRVIFVEARLPDDPIDGVLEQRTLKFELSE